VYVADGPAVRHYLKDKDHLVEDGDIVHTRHRG
jgi:hypothetical protein